MIDKAIWSKRVQEGREQLWINGERSAGSRGFNTEALQERFPWLPTREELCADRERMRAYLSEFELDMNSELRRIAEFQQMLIPVVGGRILGDWYVKMDSDMPMIGSIKARGGLYELINHAVRLLRDAGMDDSPRGLRTDVAKQLFAQHTVMVSSTGNLGISIGLLGRRIGFRVQVHMSHDAQEWKMEALRQAGAEVILHDADYSETVTKGREQAGHSGAYFVDDETSVDLFRGYALAAFEIAESFERTERPLFVYLPCGVGGAPAGVAYGLKLLLGERVHLFFAEPTAAPCVLCGLASGEYNRTTVYAYDQNNRTIADGLAVPRMSGLVGPLLAELVDGIYTVSDDKLLWLLFAVYEKESIRVEPSAAASLVGPVMLFYTQEGFHYLLSNEMLDSAEEIVHISWSTGGGLMPDALFEQWKRKGQELAIDTLWD